MSSLLRLSFTLVVLCISGWSMPGWTQQHLGPRRDMRTTDYARLTPTMWSDELKSSLSTLAM